MSILPANSRCIATEAVIEAAISRMADDINADFENQCLILLTVLNGGMIMASRLSQKLKCDLLMDCLQVSRYNNEEAGSVLNWKHEPEVNLAEHHVLIVDDILDEGDTLHAIIQYCEDRSARSVSTAVLIDKQHDRRRGDYCADYTGLTAEDHYLFGMGMDYRGRLRHLPEIYALPDKPAAS